MLRQSVAAGAAMKLTDEVLLCWGRGIMLPGWLVVVLGGPF